jgi:predicted dehydrogenase
MTAFTIMQAEHARGVEANSKINMAIIGTGGRGRHDGRTLLKTGKVKVAALADYFDFQMKEPADLFDVDASRCFAGIDGYKQVMALPDIDAVLLTTTPYFRPIHFEAAIAAGKHVFAEKPIAVDAWGCRKFLETGKLAEKKKLTVGAGLQTRYEPGHQKIAELIHDGAIGKLIIGHSTRMGEDLWRRDLPKPFTKLDIETRNWLYYLWGGGDFIVEMHIHNIDVFNWFSGMLPISAMGSGGREVRLDVGDIYDHINVIYDYPNGFHLSHTGTQIPTGCYGSVKHIIGTEGYYDNAKGLYIKKENKFITHKGISEAVEEEMNQFTASVLGEIPYLNNSEYVVDSTFTCILGRTAAYQNKKITWKELWDANEQIPLPS